MSDRKGKQSASAQQHSSKVKIPLESIIKTRSAQAREEDAAPAETGVAAQSERAQSSKKQRISVKRSRTERGDTAGKNIGAESSPKKVKVLPSIATPIRKQVRSPAIPKRESHTPFFGDQMFGDEQHSSSTHIREVSQMVKPSSAHEHVESSGNKSSGSTHTFGHPPLPPSGLEGHGSYVWVPHAAVQVANNDHVPVEDESNSGVFVDDVSEERDDRMSGTDEDEYVDPHAADYMDFPEDNDIKEPHISADEEESVTKQPSGVANLSHDTVYLEDIDPGTSHSKGSTCEIWSLFNSEDDYKELMDPMLISAYPSLPPLRYHALTTWRSDNEVSGLIMWSSWKNQLRKPNMNYLSKFITFQRFDNFFNPARVDPASFTTFTDSYLWSIKSRQNNKIGLCLSPVYIAQCRLLEPHPHSLSATSLGNQMLLKSVDCIFHSYEWERSASFWCTVFGADTMRAQLNGGAISLETKPSNLSSNMVEVESSAPGLFSASASPSKKITGAVSTNKVKIQLKHTDTIPIFDGRSKQFDLNRSLEQLERILPPFDGEIPSGSLALVAYTANAYHRSRKAEGSMPLTSQSIKNLALNINWAIVLGVPK